MPGMSSEATDDERTSFDTPRIRSIGRSVFDPIWAVEEHASVGSELVHVLRGEVRVEARGYAIEGRPGDTIYTPRGMPHRDVFPLDSTFEVYLIHFDWPGESSMLGRVAPVDLTAAAAASRGEVASDCQRLYEDFLRGGDLADQLTSLRLLQIILTMCRGASAANATDDASETRATGVRRQTLLREAQGIIRAQFAQTLSLDVIADQLEISPYYLSRIFSESSGFTLSHFLTQVRMERAAELLSEGRLPIGDVGRQVGYADSRYFARVFKAHFDCSPSAYRSRSTA